MSTNKQALRECFEKWWEINYHNGKPPRFGWEYWRDGEGYQIDDDESELDGMWESWQAAHSEKLEAAEKRIAELESENEYIRVRFKESDLLFGKLILTMRAAVIEQEHGEGDKAAMDWIFNQLAGPGEFAPESEEDAQEYFNREVEKIDVEFSKCMDYFTKRREGLRAAGITVKGE